MKKPELSFYNLFEIAIEKANFPRYEWHGGDDTIRNSDMDIITDSRFWKQLIYNMKYRLKLKDKDLENDNYWLKYAFIYFKLHITKGNCKKFWKDLLNK